MKWGRFGGGGRGWGQFSVGFGYECLYDSDSDTGLGGHFSVGWESAICHCHCVYGWCMAHLITFALFMVHCAETLER